MIFCEFWFKEFNESITAKEGGGIVEQEKRGNGKRLKIQKIGISFLICIVHKFVSEITCELLGKKENLSLFTRTFFNFIDERGWVVFGYKYINFKKNRGSEYMRNLINEGNVRILELEEMNETGFLWIFI